MTPENLKFDEEGFHYFMNSEHVWQADGYEFISSAYICEEDYRDRVLYITFKDGFLADFSSEEIVEQLDEKLKKIRGVESVLWEDRELFNITFREGELIPDLIKRIDKKMVELSKEQ